MKEMKKLVTNWSYDKGNKCPSHDDIKNQAA